MQSAIERRQQVLEAISDRRTERIENLAAEFAYSHVLTPLSQYKAQRAASAPWTDGTSLAGT